MFVVTLYDGTELTVPNLDVEDEAMEFRDPDAEEMIGVAPLPNVLYAIDESHVDSGSGGQ